MDNKILLQDLFAGVSLRSGSSKKDSESFVRTFFEIIEQYLLQDKIVKIKGLGTFKIVEVSGRDSVNVNTGERIHIKGHSKMTFTPDAAIRDHVNRPFADFETVILNEGVDIAAMEYVDPAQQEPDELETTYRMEDNLERTLRGENNETTLRPQNGSPIGLGDFVQPADPIADEPIVDEPIVDEPIVDEPIVEEPIVDEPIVEESIVEEPIVDEPVVDEPVVEESIVDESVVDEPIVDEPIVDEPVVDELVADGPVVEESIADEPVVDESIVDEPVVDELVADEPVVDELVADGPVVDEPIADEPIVDELVVEESIADEPVVDEPIVDEPVVDDPAVEQTVEEPSEEREGDEASVSQTVDPQLVDEAVKDTPLEDELAEEDTIYPKDDPSPEKSESTLDEPYAIEESNTEDEEKEAFEEPRPKRDVRFVRPHYEMRHTYDKHSDDTDKGGLLANLGKGVLCLLAVVLIFGVGYLAGSHHLFGEGCETKVYELIQSQTEQQSSKQQAVIEKSEQTLDSEVECQDDEETDDVFQDGFSEDDGLDNSPNIPAGKRNADTDSSFGDESQPVRKAQKDGKASTDQAAKPVVDDSSKYPQVQGGAYLIVGVDKVHSVKPGESVNALAKRYFGDMDQAVYIIKLNNLVNPDIVEIGQKLKIPLLKRK